MVNVPQLRSIIDVFWTLPIALVLQNNFLFIYSPRHLTTQNLLRAELTFEAINLCVQRKVSTEIRFNLLEQGMYLIEAGPGRALLQLAHFLFQVKQRDLFLNGKHDHMLSMLRWEWLEEQIRLIL